MDVNDPERVSADPSTLNICWWTTAPILACGSAAFDDRKEFRRACVPQLATPFSLVTANYQRTARTTMT